MSAQTFFVFLWNRNILRIVLLWDFFFSIQWIVLSILTVACQTVHLSMTIWQHLSVCFASSVSQAKFKWYQANPSKPFCCVFYERSHLYTSFFRANLRIFWLRNHNVMPTLIIEHYINLVWTFKTVLLSLFFSGLQS